MRVLERIPLRFRITLIYGIWMAVLLPAAGWGVYTLVERNLMESIDAALFASAQAMVDQRIQGDSLFLDRLLSELLGERRINASARIVDLSGKVRSHTLKGESTLPITKAALNRAEQGLVTFETFARKNKFSFRLLTVPISYEGHFSGDIVQVGASLETLESDLNEIAAVLWIAFPVALLISLGVGFYLTGSSLAPVNAIQQAASSLGVSDMSKRLPLPKADDELRRLTKTFNGMLDRLEEAFGRLRRFSSDVSHELRTPLAAIRGETELALLRERSLVDYKSSLQNIKNESLHMTRIVDNLLLLARAESKAVAFAPISSEIDSILVASSSPLKQLFSERRVTLKIEHETGGKLICVAAYVEIILTNLLSNAVKHSFEDGTVILKVTRTNTAVYFDVIDHGEGISDDQISFIFDPFYRIDTARNRELGGAGIGLSLAMALARLHSGDIKVNSELGKGCVFSLYLPQPSSLQESV